MKKINVQLTKDDVLTLVDYGVSITVQDDKSKSRSTLSIEIGFLPGYAENCYLWRKIKEAHNA